MQQSEDLSFLRFFLTEPIYLIPEQEQLHTYETKEVKEEENSEPISESAGTLQDSSSTLIIPETEGKNLQGILVLYYDRERKSLNPNDKAFLGKILNAVKLDFDDIALCNWAPLELMYDAQKNIFESIQEVKSNIILVFGELPLAWSLSHFFQKYHITQDAAGKKLLLADDLHEVAQNRELKVQLWNSLQSMFH